MQVMMAVTLGMYAVELRCYWYDKFVRLWLMEGHCLLLWISISRIALMSETIVERVGMKLHFISVHFVAGRLYILLSQSDVSSRYLCKSSSINNFSLVSFLMHLNLM
jgi:hypothetical protein